MTVSPCDQWDVSNLWGVSMDGIKATPRWAERRPCLDYPALGTKCQRKGKKGKWPCSSHGNSLPSTIPSAHSKHLQDSGFDSQAQMLTPSPEAQGSSCPLYFSPHPIALLLPQREFRGCKLEPAGTSQALHSRCSINSC